ncbi:NADH-ubiquinone oxidoreductase-F iron-sulfur binding region domain-containing protein [Nanoarchaeota archaeon]
MQILRETKLEALKKARKLGQKGVLKILEKKALVGRGGAGYPTAKKWRKVIETKSDEKFVICNADEGEPGTFKDKFILKHNTETMIEGLLITAFTVKAKKCFIYLRGEYDFLRKKLRKQIDDVVKRSGMNIEIEIVRGAGAYICGESTAIIQSIMGFRGQPTYKPPYPSVSGLWGKPTVINNVETLTCVAQAILYDDWDPDVRLFSISGNIDNPGVYEFNLGVKMSTIIDIAHPKKKLKAMSFGCFGGIMPIDENMRITPDTICREDCHHGAYSIIFIDETNNVVDISYSIAKFYAYESCGKCTPCREGTIRLLNLLKKVRQKKAKKQDLDLMKEFAEHIQETSLCGLGKTAGQHVITSLEHFPEDYRNYMKK